MHEEQSWRHLRSLIMQSLSQARLWVFLENNRVRVRKVLWFLCGSPERGLGWTRAGAVEWGRRSWGFHPPLWVPVTAVTNRHSLGGLKQQKFSLTVRQGRAPPEASGRVTFLAPQLLVAASLQCHLHLQHGLPCIFPSVSCKDT